MIDDVDELCFLLGAAGQWGCRRRYINWYSNNKNNNNNKRCIKRLTGESYKNQRQTVAVNSTDRPFYTD